MLEGTANILISGAGHGIGRALARHFVSKGHKIFIVDLDNDAIKHTATVHLKEYSNQVGYEACNLRSVDEIRSTVKKAAKFFDGRIDHLINNAGISSPYWSDNMTMEHPATLKQWQAYIDTNLTGSFVMSQACIPYMKVENKSDTQKLPGSNVGMAGPCIIHIGSFRSQISDPNQEGYATSKAGLLGLTHSMAVSLQIFGIRVNLVAPGKVKAQQESVEGDENEMEWDVNEKDAQLHPTNRAGKPEDIAEACEYLMGAGFVTGQDLTVDGGVSKLKTKA